MSSQLPKARECLAADSGMIRSGITRQDENGKQFSNSDLFGQKKGKIKETLGRT